MTTSFDPTVFLNTTTEETLDTKLEPCPAGEYLALADKVDVKPWAAKDGSSSGLKLVILWEIQDEGVKELLGRQKVVVPQEQMLDLTEQGNLDLGKGKNVGLGRIREALGLNTPGQPFAMSMITGRPAKVVVSHRTSKDNPEDLFHEIKRIASTN